MRVGRTIFSHCINNKLKLKLNDPKYAKEMFELIDQSRGYLREWLPWLDMNTTVQDTEAFIGTRNEKA